MNVVWQKCRLVAWEAPFGAALIQRETRGSRSGESKCKAEKKKYPIPFFVLIPLGNEKGGTHAKRRQQSPGLSVLIFIRGERGFAARSARCEQIRARGPLRNPPARLRGGERCAPRPPARRAAPAPCLAAGTAGDWPPAPPERCPPPGHLWASPRPGPAAPAPRRGGAGRGGMRHPGSPGDAAAACAGAPSRRDPL